MEGSKKVNYIFVACDVKIKTLS